MEKVTEKRIIAAVIVLVGALFVQWTALCAVEDGDGFMEQGQYRKAAEANPNFARAYYWIARIQMENGNFENTER